MRPVLPVFHVLQDERPGTVDAEGPPDEAHGEEEPVPLRRVGLVRHLRPEGPHAQRVVRADVGEEVLVGRPEAEERPEERVPGRVPDVVLQPVNVPAREAEVLHEGREFGLGQVPVLVRVVLVEDEDRGPRGKEAKRQVDPTEQAAWVFLGKHLDQPVLAWFRAGFRIGLLLKARQQPPLPSLRGRSVRVLELGPAANVQRRRLHHGALPLDRNPHRLEGVRGQ
mmetsp:Transcript_28662/g.64010  ORF Transcript_28662/g.64010 Transcript_28662/m.64010 type:complete len:224 (-) Transcript_28662:94-765(-)